MKSPLETITNSLGMKMVWTKSREELEEMIAEKMCEEGIESHALIYANKLGMNALRLASHSSPDSQFDVLVRNKVAGTAGNLADCVTGSSRQPAR